MYKILAFLDPSPFWCQVPRPRCSGDHIHGAVPENRRDQTTVGNPACPQNEADQECHDDSTASLVTMCQPEQNGRKEHHRPSLKPEMCEDGHGETAIQELLAKSR